MHSRSTGRLDRAVRVFQPVAGERGGYEAALGDRSGLHAFDEAGERRATGRLGEDAVGARDELVGGEECRNRPQIKRIKRVFTD